MSFTAHDAQVRRDICGDCRSACPEHRAGWIDHAAPCEACPRRIWHAWGDCAAVARPIPLTVAQIAAGGRLPLGLGDLVERVAHPIARWIDARTARLGGRWRTKLAGCRACGGRRHRWNRLVRDVRSIKAWFGILKAVLSRPEKRLAKTPRGANLRQ